MGERAGGWSAARVYNSEVPKEVGGNEDLGVSGHWAAGKDGTVELVIADTEGESEEHEEADEEGEENHG